jgi:hypothetical protein
MNIVNIYDRDPNHANRLFDINGAEYSFPLALNIPELPFRAIVDSKRRMVTDIIMFESDIVVFQTNTNLKELIAL